VYVATRNPYYHKVDTEGNQLPYIDNVQVEYVDNLETLKVKVMAGEVDYINAPIGENFAEWPVLAQNAEVGNYRLLLAGADFCGIFNIMPNLANQDPQKGPLLQDKNFRIALSHAINRQEIIDLLATVATFQGEPVQTPHIVSASQFHNETLAKQYTEYNPELANQMLDELGLTARGEDGFRLGLDGQPMAFTLSVPGEFSDQWVNGALMIAEYWKAVGLNFEVKNMAADIWNELVAANGSEVTILSTGSGGMMTLNEPHVRAYACVAPSWYTYWGYAYGQWVATEGAAGIEPPAEILKLNDLYNEVLVATSMEAAAAKLKELTDAFADVFPQMGISTPLPSFCVATNRIKNGPSDYDPYVTFAFGVGGTVDSCQWYIAE
ncbi:MAG: hypothetical protein IJD86_11855, partial [Clostridia bacterium]|nr:hypothetical protein [Clostridia bacterium]